MSYSISTDEVAEDYRRALEDLTMNSRWEISNLTVIAKENTEHALAISEALKDHIKKIAPAKKLPAFYVLDSVVKNVGTPYTLFFGRGLYSTFMEAYALVDGNVRRKMEEMLKTWKEPVPGSIDTRPVFPVDVTRPIESALFKAKTSAIQAQQEHERSQKQLFSRSRPGSAQPQPPYRSTPTPPNATRQQYAPPTYPPSYTQQYPPQGNGQQFGNQQYGQQRYPSPQPAARPQYPPQPSTTPSWPQQIPEQNSGMSGASLYTLNRDVANLIDSTKAEYGSNADNSLLQKLRALLDLQTVLSKQKLTSDQFDLIRRQVSQLSVPVAPAPIPVPQPTPVVVQPSPAQQPTLSSLLGPGALAALLARQSATPQAQTPPLPAKLPVQSPRASYAQPVAAPVQAAPATAVSLPDPSSLLEKLRAAGILPAVTSTPPAPVPAPQNALSGTLPPGFPPSLPFIGTPPVFGNAVPRPVLAEIPNDVVLNSNSLKIPRPHLISGLYEKLGAPCTQCGRRFQSDAEGKAKKTAHMDWHFRVHQRMTEAEKRGQHRSWYVDELDWIKTRETDQDQVANTNGFPSSQETVNSAAKAPKLQYLAVPDDPVLANSVCPICQEKFDTKWLDDAQDFVWMDAVMIAGRIYHASCHSEARRDGATPDRVLGKRKAEEILTADRTRIKSEPV